MAVISNGPRTNHLHFRKTIVHDISNSLLRFFTGQILFLTNNRRQSTEGKYLPVPKYHQLSSNKHLTINHTATDCLPCNSPPHAASATLWAFLPMQCDAKVTAYINILITVHLNDITISNKYNNKA